MGGYWSRKRLILTIVVFTALAAVTSWFAVMPYLENKANDYNSQSMYRNTDIDFIAPEPSFAQIEELPGTNGIKKVFPFYLTKAQVTANGNNKTTTVLLSDRFDNIDLTMYNEKRLIKKSDKAYDDAVYVDWSFCQNTNSTIGDIVSFEIAGRRVEYHIYAIYESNTVYEGGTVLVQINDEIKEEIKSNSKNNGYSGMYIEASDYNTCRAYLISDYRPLGRLKNREQFDDEDQYNIHYDAIMSSGYANEITDFRIREAEYGKQGNFILVLICNIMSFAIILFFNYLMEKRGCEKIYFKKQCIPIGRKVTSYYVISFFVEMMLSITIYVGILVYKICNASLYITSSVFDFWVILFPIVVLIAEIISLVKNLSMVSEITRKVNEELKAKEEAEKKAKGEAERKSSEGSKTNNQGDAMKSVGSK